MRTPSLPAESSWQTYRRVCDLVQQGHTHQARELALTIRFDHLRCRALCWPTTAGRYGGPTPYAAEKTRPRRGQGGGEAWPSLRVGSAVTS